VSVKQKCWLIFGILLTASVVAEYWMHPHPHFEVDGLPTFYAVYGFVSCVVIVLVSKLLGFVLKRKEDYYVNQKRDR